MGRYPFTYSADFIRMHAGYTIPYSNGIKVPKLSRSDASQLTTHIAEAIGWHKERLCNRLADAFLKENPEVEIDK